MSGWPELLPVLPALTGAVISIALLHLWLWLGRRRDPLPLWVAAWCGVTLLFLAGRQMQLAAEIPAAAINGARLAWLAALALFPVIICLGHTLAGRPPALRVVVPVAALNAVLAVLGWTTELFVTRQLSVRHDALMGVDFLSPLPGPLIHLMVPYILLVFVYVWVTGLRHLPHEQPRERQMVRAGFFLYVLFGVNDVLYAARLVPTVRIFDFGFVAVAVGLSHLFIRRHNRLQAGLEDMVGERTRQLEARGAELGALVRAGQALTVGLDLESTLQRIVEEARRITGSPYINLMLVDRDAGVLRVAALSGTGVPPGFQVPLGVGFSGVVAATGEPLFVPDTLTDPRNALAERDRAEGIRTYLGLPVKTGTEVLGVVSVSTPSTHVYTRDEIAYLSTFASQAASALDNARLYEAATQRGHRLATLATLTESLTATLSRDEVLDRVVRQAAVLIGSGTARLWLLEEDGQTLSLQAHAGDESGVTGVVRMKVGEGLMGRVAATRAPMVIEDLEQSAERRNAERHRAEGTVAFAGVPLVLGERLVGALGLGLRERRRFGAEELSLLQSLANHAAIAIENARLYGVVKTRLERLETVTRLNRLMSSSLDMTHVLEEIARAAGELANVGVASFWLVHEDARTLDLAGFSAPEMQGDYPMRAMSFDEGLVGWVAAHRRPLRASDIHGDARVSTDSKRWARDHGLRSFYGLPVIHEGTLLAVLGLLGRQPFDPSSEEENLLQGFVAQAAVAIRNASLYAAEAAARREAELALAQVKQLQGMLPICAYCKKIRNDRNYWESIEGYIGERSQATFSHGICPECRDTVVAAQMQEYRRSLRRDG